MSGCIGTPCNEAGRYSLFTAAIARLDKPPGTDMFMVQASDREQGRNMIVRMMLEAGHDWLLFLDDDQIFHPSLLTDLLAHDVEIVGGLYLRRDEPFTANAYIGRTAQGGFVPIDLNDYQGDELLEVDAVGTGAMLIRRGVFERMPEPWFVRGEMTEDLIFCAAQDGLIYCDLGARVGHMTTVAVWPASGDAGWAASFTVSNTTFFREQPRIPDLAVV